VCAIAIACAHAGRDSVVKALGLGEDSDIAVPHTAKQTKTPFFDAT
jgi:hypothetical protein